MLLPCPDPALTQTWYVGSKKEIASVSELCSGPRLILLELGCLGWRRAGRDQAQTAQPALWPGSLKSWVSHPSIRATHWRHWTPRSKVTCFVLLASRTFYQMLGFLRLGQMSVLQQCFSYALKCTLPTPLPRLPGSAHSAHLRP